ncbi:sensor histidine kinase [Streptomyces sp. NPDC092296]|uniref:sensor histidine kinase n=1 Tax=Streptomyces sp. NPDC092296 TaxID=3366012 RepID=UPI003809D848
MATTDSTSTAGGAETQPDGPRHSAARDQLQSGQGIPAPRLARAITVAALSCFLLITLLNIAGERQPGGPFAAAVAALAAIFALQLHHSAPGANQAPRRRKALTLGVQALLTYLPLIAFQWEWGSMAGFLAGSLLLLLPARLGWTLYALVGLSMLLAPLLDGQNLLNTVYLCESTLLTGVVVYGLSRLAELVVVIHAAREELARMAVANERLRFARDLHDLLGYSLSAITLKAELIRRTMHSHPDRASDEVTAVLDISRQALADVRLVASGYRDMSLAQECASARSVLTAAEVTAVVTVDFGDLDPRVETVLATVLREGVTNVLRHSKVRHCTIEAAERDGLVRLTIVNDGVQPEHRDADLHSGSGLVNLALRLGAVGGTLSARVDQDGRFQLTAETPVRPTGQLGVRDSGKQHGRAADSAAAA